MTQPILDSCMLTGERVVLRPVRIADAAEAFRILHKRNEVLDWLIWSGPDSRAEMERYYEHWRVDSDDGANYHFALEEREGAAFCGTLGLRFLGHAFTGDLGYWVAPEHWNRGLGSEAIALSAWLAFERLETVLLTARVFLGNEASNRVLLKNGFQRDHVSTLDVHGEQRRLQHWSLAATTWREHEPAFTPLAAEVRVR